MALTLMPQTEARLREEAERTGQNADALADALLHNALEEAAREYEETCAAIAEGLADMEAGRTVSLEDARVAWEAEKSARRGAEAAV